MSINEPHTAEPIITALTPEQLSRRISGHLRLAESAYPGLWREFALFRDRRSEVGANWSESCWMPIAAGIAVATHDAGCDLRLVQETLAVSQWGMSTPAVLTALATWRLGKAVIRFDTTLADHLDETDDVAEIPAGILTRLPTWCMYITAPEGVHRALGVEMVHGAFVHVESDSNTGRQELRLLIDADCSSGPELIPVALYIDRGTVTASLEAFIANAVLTAQQNRPGIDACEHDVRSIIDADPSAAAAVGTLRALVMPWMSRILYLCSEEPDIADADHPGRKLAHTESGGTRKPWTGATSTTTWDVGYRIGSIIRVGTPRGLVDRTITQPSKRRDVRPHWRRAHWHIYRVGEGRRQTRLRWIAPTPIMVADLGQLPLVDRTAMG